jgi:hypothetical protein
MIYFFGFGWRRQIRFLSGGRDRSRLGLFCEEEDGDK